MTETVNEIAERMRTAADDPVRSVALLGSLFASSVDLHHDPPGPNDGPIPGAVLAETSRREVEAVGRLLPDGFARTSHIAVEGEAIRVRNRLSGTLADGSPIEVETNTLFSVAEGAIVGLRAEMDATTTERWREILSGGGFAPRTEPDP